MDRLSPVIPKEILPEEFLLLMPMPMDISKYRLEKEIHVPLQLRILVIKFNDNFNLYSLS